MKNLTLLRILIIVLALVAVACGSDAASTNTSGGSESDPVDQDISEPVSEQDIDQARATFDEGMRRWRAAEMTSYTMTIGVQTISEVRVDVVDGVATSTTIVRGDPDRWETDLPKTIDEVFVVADLMIIAFEEDSSLVPDEGECGHHFNMLFDSDLGFPKYYDSLGPCDDGVGIFVEVARLNFES